MVSNLSDRIRRLKTDDPLLITNSHQHSLLRIILAAYSADFLISDLWLIANPDRYPSRAFSEAPLWLS